MRPRVVPGDCTRREGHPAQSSHGAASDEIAGRCIEDGQSAPRRGKRFAPQKAIAETCGEAALHPRAATIHCAALSDPIRHDTTGDKPRTTANRKQKKWPQRSLRPSHHRITNQPLLPVSQSSAPTLAPQLLMQSECRFLQFATRTGNFRCFLFTRTCRPPAMVRIRCNSLTRAAISHGDQDVPGRLQQVTQPATQVCRHVHRSRPAGCPSHPYRVRILLKRLPVRLRSEVTS
ncbi:hypothetical protein LMG28140_02337 [Paraburkholderia metrosideri]|jgi:hypothetical protein|uniref:Uncharacterized protein n=1 Tax=Paraburkholderia metrosideri TaxID=580937 RepID=A0ABM8NKJ1_9BURK|nr:hypothetical protein LMG28140_02337 [Paraburkholderia metrosideri]